MVQNQAASADGNGCAGTPFRTDDETVAGMVGEIAAGMVEGLTGMTESP
jgi:hypothetical protein